MGQARPADPRGAIPARRHGRAGARGRRRGRRPHGPGRAPRHGRRRPLGGLHLLPRGRARAWRRVLPGARDGRSLRRGLPRGCRRERSTPAHPRGVVPGQDGRGARGSRRDVARGAARLTHPGPRRRILTTSGRGSPGLHTQPLRAASAPTGALRSGVAPRTSPPWRAAVHLTSARSVTCSPPRCPSLGRHVSPPPEPPVRLRLTPRDNTFFDLFAASAQHLVTGANLLSEMLGADRAGRKEINKRIGEAEHLADEATHSIMRRLNQTFVTPFDRDDIYMLAASLDDCMDYMEEASDLIVLYKLEELPARVADQVHVLQRAAELTAEAMPRLRSMSDLAEYWVEINRLENQADKAHRKLLAQLFDEITDPILLMKLKEVVEKLEDAADAFEKVANTVETIALKES